MPRKTERGILGYKKDPKKQVLFSFNPRDGDECPTSDSEDSDYLPSDEERPSSSNSKNITRKQASRNNHGNKTGKRKSHDQSDTRAKKVARLSQNEASLVLTSDFQGRLPPEVWLKIFKMVVYSDGALPFLCRAAKVCCMWRELAENPLLWDTVDLSYGWIKSQDQTLIYLANQRLSQCQTLSLSMWKNLTNQAVKVLSEKCPLLKSINLSYCKKLTSEGITALVNNCCDIEDMDLSFTSNDAVSVSCLKNLVQKLGGNLRHLTIGGNTLKGFPTFLTTLMNSCPSLETLDVSNAVFSADFVSLNIEAFQAHCSKLRVLRLTNSKFRASYVSQRLKAESPGFPQLEQVSLAVSTSGLNSSLGFDDDFLSRLLKSSVELRLLDLRGCTNLSTTSLQHLPVTHLVQLHLSQSSVTKYADLDMVFRKWRHSLTHVDLSWNSFPENLDKGVAALAEGDQPSPLEHLNIAGTSVGVTPVKLVLELCPKLIFINLTSCRSLPRGVKREFSGKNKIDKLKKEFEDVSDSELDSLSD
ncbi:F-box/LRR-repeat protein 6-like [Haliotis rufescens]|uniref:F-box/LRR-repeat protein 6-like n=1 Tax=Haliotis rufescens TaxID=6454 RepID=UPI00201E8C2E|nr:F-box/LRR-repeat protein 6-like [Haliotis rufescens]XP_048245101.1 F-box/LRR-repeat protein 6-like [Haliotis rufescens]